MIVEDRGPLGADGTHIFVVHVPMPPAEPMTFELPEDWIEPLHPHAKAR